MTSTTVTPRTDEQTETTGESKTAHYPMWKVLIHNDDVTPFVFVIAVLVRIFNKDNEQAFKITNAVHTTGIGLAGVYTYEQAEFRLEQTESLARGAKYPLKLTMEKA